MTFLGLSDLTGTLNNTAQRQKNAGHGFTTAGEAPQLTPHLLGGREKLGGANGPPGGSRGS